MFHKMHPFVCSSLGRFEAYSTKLEPNQIFKVQITQIISAKTSTILQWSEVIKLWQQDDEFRELFTTVLAKIPYPAFFWETPPINQKTLEQTFEFVTLNSPQLANVLPEPDAFAQHIGDSMNRDLVKVFPNLGGDALLIAPCQNGPQQHYTHLAKFVRCAPKKQIDKFWRTIGYTLEQTLQAREPHPLWVSTSGLGVYWLHVRIDSFPKYYQHAPYR
ncbi:MAG: hypothetical protein F6K58_14615 [Symploca sp. SIO2E9]|nr:hypothetical protein [Symploca sp. SIO2E9]